MTMMPYTIVEEGRYKAQLVCPRKGCLGEFTINKKLFREAPALRPTTIGRSCPYCMRVSLVPENL